MTKFGTQPVPCSQPHSVDAHQDKVFLNVISVFAAVKV